MEGLFSVDEIEGLLVAFAFDPETGALTSQKTGRVAAGKNKHGYITVQFNQKKYYAHRLAWLIATGSWPKGQIDHKNRDRSDNRLQNLRDVSRSENLQNRVKSTGKTGLLGVTYLKKGNVYQARIYAGRSYNLGRFATAEEAHAAYLSAKNRFHVKNCT